MLTGMIGLLIVIACAATLHARGITISDAGDAARALEPLAGHLAATLFGFGLGAALLAAAESATQAAAEDGRETR